MTATAAEVSEGQMRVRESEGVMRMMTDDILSYDYEGPLTTQLQ